MVCGVYKITNKLNGKSYIGASIDIERRWKAHKCGTSNIGKDIKKEGIENFEFEVLHECSKDELRANERKYIDKFNTFHDGYNLSPGGETHPRLTGFYGVSKRNSSSSKIGYYYMYAFKKGDEFISLSHMDLSILKQKVQSRNFPWKIVDVNKANKTILENKEDLKGVTYFTVTGFYRVSISNDGFYAYQYTKNGKSQNPIKSVNIHVLKKKIKDKGLPWFVLDEKKALETIKKSDELNKNYIYQDFTNKTGFLRVSTKKTGNSQGFTYVYNYYDGDKRKRITSVDLNKLKMKVESKGLEWKIIDVKKAERTVQENELILKNKFKYSNSTGFYRVTQTKWGRYVYSYREQRKCKYISDCDICVLEKKVKDKGLPWRIVNEKVAEQTILNNNMGD